MKEHILIRDKEGKAIPNRGEEFKIIQDIIDEAQKIICKLNTQYWTQEEIIGLFSKLTGKKVDNSLRLMPPFYTDFGNTLR